MKYVCLFLLLGVFLANHEISVAEEEVPTPVSAETALPPVLVYKTETCGCCNKWIEHLEAHGFKVEAINMRDMKTVKQSHQVPMALSSCHTAKVGEYVIEGHVPAPDVIRLIREKKLVSGLAVPGMPIGSPGMEGPNPENYEVYSFQPNGRTEVFARHGPAFD